MNRKTHILNSAENLSRSRGYDGFSYADIEKDVGIRKASIHHHFSSKSELSLALILRYRTEFFAKLDAISTGQSLGGERLNNYVDLYLKALSGGKKLCLCVSFSAGRAGLDQRVLKELNAFHTQSIDWLTQVFELGVKDKTISDVVNPANEAAACLALVEGAQIMARAAENSAPFKAATASLKLRIL